MLAALAAVVGAVIWWYAPRVGYWVLLVDGLLTMAISGVALARGARAVVARRVLGRLCAAARRDPASHG